MAAASAAPFKLGRESMQSFAVPSKPDRKELATCQSQQMKCHSQWPSAAHRAHIIHHSELPPVREKTAIGEARDL